MGKILLQRYEVLRVLGAGGAGKVYLALDMHLDRLVAVKESRENLSLTEMELLKDLEHPGLPAVYDYFEEEGNAFLIMEYVEGMSLRQYLNQHKRVSEGQAVKWALDLCRILKYLHDRHPAVIYRDLKPENIIIRQNGGLKLIDLGGAVRYACGGESLEICAGTAGYCPLEQWKGMRADVSWDIYSLGVVFHEMLTGHHPAKPPYGRFLLSEYDRSLTKTLEKVILCCTQKGKAAKYQSVGQVEEALLKYRKRSLPAKLWQSFGKLFMTVSIYKMTASLCIPLLKGIPEERFPFPWLYKPLFFLILTLLLYLLFFRLKFKKSCLCRQEKNIWLTQKQFSGLFSVFLSIEITVFLGRILYPEAAYHEMAAPNRAVLLYETGTDGISAPFTSMPVALAGEKAEQLWVEMRDDSGRKLLLKDDAVYITSDCVRFELPTKRLPEDEISLQMVAVGEQGEVYNSRIFHIKAEEDLN